MKITSLAAVLAVSAVAVGQVSAFESDGHGGHKYTQDELAAFVGQKDARYHLEQMARARQAVDSRKNVQKQRRWSPSNGYVPADVACPPMPQGNNYVGMIRNASDFKMNSQEADYMKRHRQKTRPVWQDWLTRAGLDGDLPGGVDQYLNENQPKVGIAISGGGYRAMLLGVGVVEGFDSRNETAMQRGVGGLLQAVDYVSGLSGGSWATGSMAINNWPTTQELLQSIYNLDSNLVFPDDDELSFYMDLFDDVGDKKDRHYPTSITDYWGRALSYQLLNDTMYKDEGQATVYSDIVNVTHFQDASYPFPIVLAIGRHDKELMIDPNATYFEYTPYEFGTWQPALQAFIPEGYLGSVLNNGQPTDNKCVAGFENFGYVVGSSSTLFNGAYLAVLQSNQTGVLTDIIKSILQDIGKGDNDVAPVPNPFRGYRPTTNGFNTAQYIDVVDGGEANQNIPLEPLLQPARNLDMIIAVDASGDTMNWPNGTALWETQKRAKLEMFSYMAFPEVPDQNTFVNEGLNTRPVFFGCNAQNATNTNSAVDKSAPLLVYLPNYPYSGWGNSNTFELAYNKDHQQAMVQNAMDVATMGGQQGDWHECLACAATMRGLQRSKAQIPDKCQKCMTKYCWNGQTNDSKAANYTPPIGLSPFILTNGTQLVEPPSTGSNDSASSSVTGIFGSDDDKSDKNAAAQLAAPLAWSTALVMASFAFALW